MSKIYTVDQIGDAGILDGLVERTLIELVDKNIKTVPNSRFRKQNMLESVDLEYTSSIQNYAFDQCPNFTKLVAPSLSYFDSSYIFRTDNSCNVTTLDLTRAVYSQFSSTAFSYMPRLQSLILRGNRVPSFQSGGILSLYGNMIGLGLGYIYVPSALVDTYKSTSPFWSAFASQIVSIDEYPKTPAPMITDSWAQILAAEANGTYTTKYHIGDTKFITINDETVILQIAAFDTDDLADNTGKAKITWLCRNGYGFHKMNSTQTTTGGWENSDMRDYLQTTVFTLLDADIRHAIKTVKKPYYDYGTNSTLVSNDTLWIPSSKEIGMPEGSSYLKEDSGVNYTGLFSIGTGTDANVSRVKSGMGINPAIPSRIYWWTRSAYDASLFSYVVNDGRVGGSLATNQYGVVFGFCT